MDRFCNLIIPQARRALRETFSDRPLVVRILSPSSSWPRSVPERLRTRNEHSRLVVARFTARAGIARITLPSLQKDSQSISATRERIARP